MPWMPCSGKPRLPKATIDNLFAISTASVTMQSELNLKPSSTAGLCFKPIESSQYDAARTEIEELLQAQQQERPEAPTGLPRMNTALPGWYWRIPILTTWSRGLHLVSQTLIERGFGSYLLCAIFRFENAKPVYWVYNFKQGRYYPFVPAPDKKRDNALEFRMRSLLERELPVEKDTGMWYPLWGIPL